MRDVRTGKAVAMALLAGLTACGGGGGGTSQNGNPEAPFDVDAYLAFLAETDPVVADAAAYLDARISQGDPGALANTVTHAQSSTSHQVDLSEDEATIEITSADGFSRSLQTDAMDRPDWQFGARPPKPEARDNAPLPFHPIATDIDGWEERVLLIFPHEMKGESSQQLAAELRSSFEGAGKQVDVVIGPADVATMRAWENYGVVSIFTHGGIIRTVQGHVRQTAISSGIPATPESIRQIVHDLGPDAHKKFGIMRLADGPYIAYTTEFFKDSTIDLSGGLILLDACRSGAATSVDTNHFSSVMEAKGATVLGWRGAVPIGMAATFLRLLAQALASGMDVNAAIAFLRGHSALQGIAWLSHLQGVSTIDDLNRRGLGTWALPPSLPPGGCGTQQVAGSDAPVSRNFDLGRTSGTFDFSWSTYTIEDRIVVRYEGNVIFDTGCVGGGGSLSLSFSGSSRMVTVQVSPNCAGDTGTAWDFTVGCAR